MIPARIALILIAALSILVAGINATYHPATVQYDIEGHAENVRILSEGRLPSRQESKEFFSPPLPYIPSAVGMVLPGLSIGEALTLGQYCNLLILVLALFYVIRIAREFWPKDQNAPVYTLLLISLCPVVYKSFAMVRGEPYLFLFAVVASYYAIQLFLAKEFTVLPCVQLGMAMAALALSRQWGILLFPALFVFALFSNRLAVPFAITAKRLCLAGLIAALCGSWFYIYLALSNKTPLAFNRKATSSFSISNQPASFYFGTGNGKLFSDPLRAAFPNQLVPIFYSEFWGDYGLYFQVKNIQKPENTPLVGWKARVLMRQGKWDSLETNIKEARVMLARSNLYGLFPTLLFVLGAFASLPSVLRYLTGKQKDRETAIRSLLLLCLLSSLGGYFWFLISFPSPGKGATIKATYMLQIVPFLALLTADFLRRFQEYKPRVTVLTVVVLTCIWILNAPAYFTGYFWSY